MRELGKVGAVEERGGLLRGNGEGWEGTRRRGEKGLKGMAEPEGQKR